MNSKGGRSSRRNTTFTKKSRLVETKPLFLTMLFFVRRRSGSDMLRSEPSRLSSKTPRLFDVKSCAQAQYFRGHGLRSLAPAVETETSKNEGLGL